MAAILIGLTGGGGADYQEAILQAGGIPVVIPDLDPSKFPDLMNSIDALLFTGGADIDPSEYGEPDHPHLGGCSPRRDAVEVPLMKYAWENTNIPILGICRGLQMMNVCRGGTLWQDLHSQHPTHLHTSSLNSFGVCHMVKVNPDSVIGEIFPDYMPVNSFHHQAIKDLAPGMRPVAWSPDGLIEAIEAEDHPCRIAFQWHPEAMYDTHDHFADMFKRFVKAAIELQ